MPLHDSDSYPGTPDSLTVGLVLLMERGVAFAERSEGEIGRMGGGPACQHCNPGRAANKQSVHDLLHRREPDPAWLFVGLLIRRDRDMMES